MANRQTDMIRHAGPQASQGLAMLSWVILTQAPVPREVLRECVQCYRRSGLENAGLHP